MDGDRGSEGVGEGGEGDAVEEAGLGGEGEGCVAAMGGGEEGVG